MTKHPQAELIKLVVDGLAVPQFFMNGEWNDCSWQGLVTFGNIYEWRAKPEVKYPETLMTGQELKKIYMDADPEKDICQDFVAIANAVLRHAIDNGQVIIAESKGE